MSTGRLTAMLVIGALALVAWALWKLTHGEPLLP